MHAPLTALRDRKTPTGEFRNAANSIADILAKEASRRLRKKGIADTHRIVLVSILRAGLALLPSFLEKFPEARVGFVGLKRDEKTFEPKTYYQNIPKISKSDHIIILDPMLATGGSAVACATALVEAGAREANMLFAGVISASEGLARLSDTFPSLDILIAVHDEKLDKKGYIVPGLGDFGDRYFGS